LLIETKSATASQFIALFESSIKPGYACRISNTHRNATRCEKLPREPPPPPQLGTVTDHETYVVPEAVNPWNNTIAAALASYTHRRRGCREWCSSPSISLLGKNHFKHEKTLYRNCNFP